MSPIHHHPSGMTGGPSTPERTVPWPPSPPSRVRDAGVHRPMPAGTRLTLPQQGGVGEQLLAELSEARASNEKQVVSLLTINTYSYFIRSHCI